MDGSNSIVGGSVDICLTNYKLVKTLYHWSSGKVRLAENVLTGEKVAIYLIDCRWKENTQMEEKGTMLFVCQQFSSMVTTSSDLIYKRRFGLQKSMYLIQILI